MNVERLHHNTMKAFRTIWLLGLCALWLSACSSTRIAGEWRDPSVAPRPIQKLAVFAVFKEAEMAKFFENEVTRQFPSGIKLNTASQLGLTTDGELEAVRSELEKSEFDAVLITRLIKVDHRDIYHPEVHTVVQQPYYYDYQPRLRVDGRHQHSAPPPRLIVIPPPSYIRVTPAYVSRESRYLVETQLYRLPEGKSVWSLTTENVSPRSSLVLVNDLLRTIQTQLTRNGFMSER